MATRTLKLITAPTGFQPGGYIGKAYADRGDPRTPTAEVDVDSSNGFRFALRWRCAHPIIDASDNPKAFVDACALLVPETPDSPWITMGAPGMGVTGVLWRADKTAPMTIHAQGLGSVARSESPKNWLAESVYGDGVWRVTFTLPEWAPLAIHRKFAVAIWQGADSERAGLKSITSDWQAL